jgi:adenylate cyclase
MTAASDTGPPSARARESRGSGFTRLSISLMLASAMGLLIVAAVAAVLTIQWRVSRDTTFELINEKAERMLDTLETGIRGDLDPAVDLADYVARRIEDGTVPLTDRSRLTELLIGSLAAAPQIEFIVTFDLNHVKFGVLRPGDGTPEVIQGNESGNPVVRAALRELAAASGPFWGELVDDNGVALINLRRPLRRGGKLLGFLAAGISVPRFSELVTRSGDLFGGTAFVLYGRDHVLAHPHLVSIRGGDRAEGPVVALGRVGDIVLGGLWDGEPVVGHESLGGADLHVVRIRVGAERYVAFYRWIGDYGEVPWAIGAWFTLSDVTGELWRLRWSGIAAVGVLLFAGLAAFLLGRAIARPIRRVATGAAEVGRLDLSHVETLPASRISELDDQARAFNTMLASLRSFETYVPRLLVRHLIREGGDRSVASDERELTVLFTDIVGYTAMSEGMPAAEVAALLNHHFALLGACVEAEDGTVDKFIGDSLMVFWGAPEVQQDGPARACRAARAMATALEADNAVRAAAGQPPVRIRIGIHTGPVVVGNIGWPGRINYTIVGDTVNACQRLESLGKEFDRGDAVTILLSEATVQRLDSEMDVEPCGQFEVKGKTEPLAVYRLLR